MCKIIETYGFNNDMNMEAYRDHDLPNKIPELCQFSVKSTSVLQGFVLNNNWAQLRKPVSQH
eukprot:7298172-Heterocapsa_arctica.AAC.1